MNRMFWTWEALIRVSGFFYTLPFKIVAKTNYCSTSAHHCKSLPHSCCWKLVWLCWGGSSNYSSAECLVWCTQIYRYHQAYHIQVKNLHTCMQYLHIKVQYLHVLYFACRDFWQIKETLQTVSLFLFPMSQIFQKNKLLHPPLSSPKKSRKTSGLPAAAVAPAVYSEVGPQQCFFSGPQHFL